MTELENPPILGEGFVQARFIGVSMGTPAGADRLPDLRGLRGNVYFKPDQRYRHVTAGTPATVFPDRLHMGTNPEGWLVDRASQADPALPPGGWLPVGRYDVHIEVSGKQRVTSFSIEVTTEHTVDSPLDLTTAAPIVLPPKAVEVTRVIDRQLAQEASSTAVTAATEAQQARDETVALGITVDTSAGELVKLGGRVLSYKSGWRALVRWDSSGNITSGTLSPDLAPVAGRTGGIYLRRDNTNVTLAVVEAQAVNSNPTITSTPIGFRGNSALPFPSVPFMYLDSGGNYQSAAMEVGATIYRFRMPSGGRLATVGIGGYGVMMSWTTAEDPPSSLPGAPA